MKKKYILSFAIIVFLLLTLHFIILHPIAIFDIDKFNAGLANIRANGTYDEILKKYLGD